MAKIKAKKKQKKSVAVGVANIKTTFNNTIVSFTDMKGNVVGINTAIFSQSGGSVGIGFAVSSNFLSLIASLKNSSFSNVFASLLFRRPP